MRRYHRSIVKRLRFLLVLSLAATALVVEAGTAQHPADVVHDFYRAFADENVERASALWIDGAFDKAAPRAMRVRCLRLVRFSVQGEALTADGAVVETEAVLLGAVRGGRCAVTRWRSSVDRNPAVCNAPLRSQA
jgi:hypothetical protein